MHYCHCSTGLLTFMRFLHTSDLHLGRSLYGVNRDETFEKFLVWLTETIRTESIDCLIIAGDVFDNATPSHRMQRAYYRFLASVATSTDCRHVIVTGGNHDSPSLLNAPDTLLEALNITVVGQATADPADEVVLLRDEDGKPIAVVAAVPYLRERDLRTSTENETQQDKEEKIRLATAEHYRRVTQTALELRGESDIPYIATGHLFAADGDPSDEERNLYIGSLGLIPASARPFRRRSTIWRLGTCTRRNAWPETTRVAIAAVPSHWTFPNAKPPKASASWKRRAKRVRFDSLKFPLSTRWCRSRATKRRSPKN